MKHVALLLLAAAASLAPLALPAAEDDSVSFDSSVDFRALKSFAIRDGQVSSDKPEIDNRLFRLRMQDDIRATLLKKGLAEDTSRPDVIVTYHFHDKDVSSVDRVPDTRIPGTAGNPGMVVRGGPSTVLYTEGTLVVDITDAAGSLLWRGTWRNQERNGPRLSKALSGDMRKLLAKYPPRRR